MKVVNRSLPIPVKTIRRPRLPMDAIDAQTLWVEPASPATQAPENAAERIALEVRSELDAMVAALHMPAAPVEVPPSGLCRGSIRSSFQGHELEWFCVQRPGHAGPCSPGSDDSAAAHEDAAALALVAELDHQDAWGCLDAPVAS